MTPPSYAFIASIVRCLASTEEEGLAPGVEAPLRQAGLKPAFRWQREEGCYLLDIRDPRTRESLMIEDPCSRSEVLRMLVPLLHAGVAS